MSGFIFDAKLARAALSARRDDSAETGVSAVVAVGVYPIAPEPQQPQQPQPKRQRGDALDLARQPQEPQPSAMWSVEMAADIEERAGLAADTVPPAYLDSWARHQIRRPSAIAEDEWRRAVNDAGLFLDEWGGQAAEIGWTAGELFDVPRDGKPGGLIWFIEGERIEAFGEQLARTDSGRIFGGRK